jgi:hypothetical protein
MSPTEVARCERLRAGEFASLGIGIKAKLVLDPANSAKPEFVLERNLQASTGQA